MNINIQTSELLKALYRVQGICEKKSALPILSHVLLTAQKQDVLTVSAMDMDIRLTGSYLAEVLESGSVALPARELYSIIKSTPSKQIQLSSRDNHWVDIQAGPGSHFHLVGLSAQEFPEPADEKLLHTFSLSAPQLLRMIERTLFCVSTDESRHNLGGALCTSPHPHVWRMVSTDAHRLALADMVWESHAAPLGLPDKDVIVARKGLQELKRVLADSQPTDKVDIGFSNSTAVVKVGSVVVSTRLVEGPFPDYTQLIPETSAKRATLPRLAFSEALRSVSLMAHGRAHGVSFSFEPSELTLAAEDPELGDAQAKMVCSYQGEPLSLGFNARYVLDVLGVIDEPTVSFELSDPLSPGILRPLEDKSFLAVVMPMRI